MKLPFSEPLKLKKEPITLFIAFMAFLFAFTCAYSLFDAIREADFLSGKKYEATDIGDVYAEKQSSPDAALVSPTLFLPLLDTLFEFPLGSSSPNTLFIQTFSVLRC
jgi:hypothetical protein